MTRTTTRALCAALAFTVSACGGGTSTPPTPKEGAGAGSGTPAPTVGDGPFKPPPIVVDYNLPNVKIDGATGSLPLSSAASYAWSAFIALNWPASTAANTRGVPDNTKTFGQPGLPTWITMRSKTEVYPGNASDTVAPHGVVLGPDNKPTNGPDYGYGDPPKYLYQNGELKACTGQTAPATPAYINLDETTQIGVNQTYAGAAPAKDPLGFNTKPQLIRYTVKMNRNVYAYAVAGQYWYGKGAALTTARKNYVTALNAGTNQNPAPPYVNFAPTPDQGTDPNLAGIEIKASWRPLTPTEVQSGRFLTSTVRYYEQPGGTSCYYEAVWGLVGMHVISFSQAAPWVIWSTFEQADNILDANGQRTEDENGNVIVNVATATSPMLSSDPNQAAPTVKAAGAYCDTPGSRLFFRETPASSALPSGGNICVNGRWTQPEPQFVSANVEAHKAIAAYIGAKGGSSPLQYYKLVGAQGVPVDYDARKAGTFSTETSYYSANVTIETDYSLGQFTGRFVNSVPSNLGTDGQTYYNTQLLPFQANRLGFSKMRMGGCAGCHDRAALGGGDFSFALGNNLQAPENTNAFAKPTLGRIFFPEKK